MSQLSLGLALVLIFFTLAFSPARPDTGVAQTAYSNAVIAGTLQQPLPR